MDGTVGGSACYASKWLDFLDPLIEQKITETGSCTVPLPRQNPKCVENVCRIIDFMFVWVRCCAGLTMIETDGPYIHRSTHQTD